MTKQELIEAVRQHALENYNSGGWDVLVECYEDSDIEEAIGGARTVEGAIRKAGEAVGTYDAYRRDIMATAF